MITLFNKNLNQEKIMKKVAIILLCSMALMSCVTSNKCATATDAQGHEYLDKNACTQQTYLLGIIPMG